MVELDGNKIEGGSVLLGTLLSVRGVRALVGKVLVGKVLGPDPFWSTQLTKRDTINGRPA